VLLTSRVPILFFIRFLFWLIWFTCRMICHVLQVKTSKARHLRQKIRQYLEWIYDQRMQKWVGSAFRISLLDLIKTDGSDLTNSSVLPVLFRQSRSNQSRSINRSCLDRSVRFSFKMRHPGSEHLCCMSKATWGASWYYFSVFWQRQMNCNERLLCTVWFSQLVGNCKNWKKNLKSWVNMS